MDPEAEIKKQVNTFYCNVEEALKAHGIVKTASGSGEQVKTPVKLPDYGLNYIIEYRSKDNFPFLYECKLCHCKTGLSNMFMHVCGSKHRMTYLVVTGAPIMRRRWQEYPNADDSPSKAKVQHVDTSCSNEEEIDCKNKDGKMPDPLEECQEEQEKDRKEQAKLDEKVEPSKATESSKSNETEERSKGNDSEKCETNKQLQEESEEVEQQEFTAHPEEFTSQEELLGYLQSFEILNEDDASFFLKVTQILTEALVEYRQQAASNKNLLDTEYNGEAALEYSTEHSDLTSADISHSDTDYSSSQSAEQYLTVNEEEHFLTGSSETAYENNITTEFLNSVRNMNIEDVTATLHKIAAANPAFRGIEIPNVIRILTESGTLRRLSNGSMQ